MKKMLFAAAFVALATGIFAQTPTTSGVSSTPKPAVKTQKAVQKAPVANTQVVKAPTPAAKPAVKPTPAAKPAPAAQPAKSAKSTATPAKATTKHHHRKHHKKMADTPSAAKPKN